MENELNKQTAVNYLIKEFSDILGKLKTEPMQDLLLVDAINKALQMEKEQIKSAYLKGDSNGCGCYDYSTEQDAEKFYTETYGNK
jgi:hypothetical protein